MPADLTPIKIEVTDTKRGMQIAEEALAQLVGNPHNASVLKQICQDFHATKFMRGGAQHATDSSKNA